MRSACSCERAEAALREGCTFPSGFCHSLALAARSSASNAHAAKIRHHHIIPQRAKRAALRSYMRRYVFSGAVERRGEDRGLGPRPTAGSGAEHRPPAPHVLTPARPPLASPVRVTGTVTTGWGPRDRSFRGRWRLTSQPRPSATPTAAGPERPGAGQNRHLGCRLLALTSG